jgi:predicted DCC family thiol-disulfide oxidoreductase YuxK
MQHLVFYDGECGLCDKVVQWLLKCDKEKIFAFAPLQGKTAQRLLIHLPEIYRGEDSLVLIENYQSTNPTYYVLGKGALRILWLLGKWKAIPGTLSFLPGWMVNWGYKIVAKNRHLFFSREACRIPTNADKSRFLD